jgi:hypothetical protein
MRIAIPPIMKHRRTMSPAANRLAFPKNGALRPSRSWPKRCCHALWQLACRRSGSRPIASMAPIGACGGGWRSSPKPMSWPSLAKSMAGWTTDNGRSRRAWPRCPRRAGHGAVRVMARRPCGGMTGAGGPWRLPWSQSSADGIKPWPSMITTDVGKHTLDNFRVVFLQGEPASSAFTCPIPPVPPRVRHQSERVWLEIAPLRNECPAIADCWDPR